MAANETVEYLQPDANSAILNRILDSNPSRIAGTIRANGAVFFVNPNGLVFEASSRVTANGFVASTVAPGNFDFMNGRGDIQNLAPTVGGGIVLSGTVTAASISALGGAVAVAGRLDASAARGRGGAIGLSAATQLTLGETAVITASGATGGGSIALGGEFRGSGTLTNVNRLEVAAGAVISADATGEVGGNGGSVVLWSQQQTDFAGLISARGGEQGGNGGTVEVSGKNSLRFRGRVDSQAPKGLAGSLVLDPGKLSILAVAPTDPTLVAGSLSQGSMTLVGNSDSYLLIRDLQTALASTNVTLDATGTADGEIVLGESGATLAWTSGNSLTLTASKKITLALSTITAPGADLYFNTNGATPTGVVLANLPTDAVTSQPVATDIAVTARSLTMMLGTGRLDASAGEKLSALGAAVYYQGAQITGGVTSGGGGATVALDLGASGRFTLVTAIGLSGAITVSASGISNAAATTILDPTEVLLSDYLVIAGKNPTWLGNFVSLGGIATGNDLTISGLRPSNRIYGNLNYFRGRGIAVTGDFGFWETLRLDSTAEIGLAASITSTTSGSELLLVAAGKIDQTAGKIAVNRVTIHGGDTVNLPSATNEFTQLGPLTVAGDTVLATSRKLNLTGDLKIGDGTLEINDPSGAFLERDIVASARHINLYFGGGDFNASNYTFSYRDGELFYSGGKISNGKVLTTDAAGLVTSRLAIDLGERGSFTKVTRFDSPMNIYLRNTDIVNQLDGLIVGTIPNPFELSSQGIVAKGNPRGSSSESPLVLNNLYYSMTGLIAAGAVAISGIARVDSIATLGFVKAPGITVNSGIVLNNSLRLESTKGIVFNASVVMAENSGRSLTLRAVESITQTGGFLDVQSLSTSAGLGTQLGQHNRIGTLAAVNQDFRFVGPFATLMRGGGDFLLDAVAEVADGAEVPASQKLMLVGDIKGDAVTLRARGLVLGASVQIVAQSLSLDLTAQFSPRNVAPEGAPEVIVNYDRAKNFGTIVGDSSNADQASFRINTTAKQVFFDGDTDAPGLTTARLELTDLAGRFYRTLFFNGDSAVMSGVDTPISTVKPSWVRGGGATAKNAIVADHELVFAGLVDDNFMPVTIDDYRMDYIKAGSVRFEASQTNFSNGLTVEAKDKIVFVQGVAVKGDGALILRSLAERLLRRVAGLPRPT